MPTPTFTPESLLAVRQAAHEAFLQSRLPDAAAIFELLLRAGDTAPEVLLSYALTLACQEQDADAKRFYDLGMKATELISDDEPRSVLDVLAGQVRDRLPGGRQHAGSIDSNLWAGR